MPIPTLFEPPKDPSESYIITSKSDEISKAPDSGSAYRRLVASAESNGSFDLIAVGGTAAPSLDFHYHQKTHEVFICTKGELNIWADDQCRTLRPGDLASIPQGVRHAHETCSPNTEFICMMAPGGWGRYLGNGGKPYQGPIFPTRDEQEMMAGLDLGQKSAAEKFDLVWVADHEKAEPQAWTDNDCILPEDVSPFFLRCSTGPRYAIGGLLLQPLVCRAQSGSKVLISRIEGPSEVKSGMFTRFRGLKFGISHHCFIIEQGTFKFQVGYLSHEVSAGEALFVPAGIFFKFDVVSKFGSMHCFASSAGLQELMMALGTKKDEPVLSEEQPFECDEQRWEALERELKFVGVKS